MYTKRAQSGHREKKINKKLKTRVLIDKWPTKRNKKKI